MKQPEPLQASIVQVAAHMLSLPFTLRAQLINRYKREAPPKPVEVDILIRNYRSECYVQSRSSKGREELKKKPFKRNHWFDLKKMNGIAKGLRTRGFVVEVEVGHG